MLEPCVNGSSPGERMSGGSPPRAPSAIGRFAEAVVQYNEEEPGAQSAQRERVGEADRHGSR